MKYMLALTSTEEVERLSSLLKGQTFSWLDELEDLFSTINNFFPEACNKYSTLENKKIQWLPTFTENYIKQPSEQSLVYLQTLVNWQFGVLHRKKIIYFFIIYFHVWNSYQKLPISCLETKRRLKLRNILSQVKSKSKVPSRNYENTIWIFLKISFTAWWIIPGSLSEPFIVNVLPLLVCPYANAVPTCHIFIN